MSEVEHTKNLIDLYNQLAIELQDIDSIEQTNLFKGRILLSENKFEESLNCFSVLNDKGYRNYWVGKLYLSQNKVDLSMEYFEKALDYYTTIGDIFEIASISIWIAQVHLLNDEAKMAVELICKSENTLKRLQVTDLKNVEVVKNNIIQRVGENYFNDIASFYKKTEFTTEKTSYILPDIPSSIKSKDNKEMILIPSGVFFFGEGKRCITSGIEILKNIDSVLDNQYFKNHAKTKYLYPFYIDKYPVTIKEFLAFCNQSNTQVPKHLEKTKKIEENLPVTNLSIKEMKEYAKWYEKEIPLPEEWEKACRTEEGYFYPWGDYWESERLPNIDEYIRYNSSMIHEVGKNAKNINKYGVCDLIGNISEITCCYENVIIKSGNIFCKSEEKLKAYHGEKINDNDKGFNIGFRCIKPVFKPNVLNVFI
ncbi:MAG: formylglycine-generating enzyme family protein [Desulfobacteraceae bacterium]|nr:formylglycine-generating enzyme family protein [Desulfobacteraceae bacterium]